MLLLAIFARVLRFIDANSSSSGEEYGDEVRADSGRIQRSELSVSYESEQCPLFGSCFRNLGAHTSAQESFRCSQCYKQFTCTSTLRTHQLIHSDGKPQDCLECGKQLMHASKLRRHQQTPTDVKSFRTDECGKHFAYAHNLSTHQRKHTGVKSFVCPDCGKKFSRSTSLQTHQRTHTGEKPFICVDCGKKFAQMGNLQTHQRTHTGEKPFLCPDCGKHFAQLSNLQTHQRTHTGEKPFTCLDCGKQFAQESTLRTHQRTHTGEKPFICLDCRKQFAQESTLRTHQRTHTGEKPFICPDCGKQFARSHYLRDHQRTHTGEKPFICPDCGKQFSQNSNRRTHQRTHTGEKQNECLQRGNGKRFERDDYLRDDQGKMHAAFENSTGGSSPEYAENSTDEQIPTFFQTVFEDSSSLNHLENLFVFNNPSLAQSALKNLDDGPSTVQMQDFTIMENPSFFHPVLEIPVDGTSFPEMEVPVAMDPFLLYSALENPVDNSFSNNLTNLEKTFLLHKKTENPVYDPSLSQNLMESRFLVHLQDPDTFGDEDFMDNPSLVPKEESALPEELIDNSFLIQPDRNNVSEVRVDSPSFFPMQERMPINPEGNVHNVQLPSGDTNAVSGSVYLECAGCSARFADKAAMENHIQNHSWSFFPIDWLSYLESDDNNDRAK